MRSGKTGPPSSRRTRSVSGFRQNPHLRLPHQFRTLRGKFPEFLTGKRNPAEKPVKETPADFSAVPAGALHHRTALIARFPACFRHTIIEDRETAVPPGKKTEILPRIVFRQEGKKLRGIVIPGGKPDSERGKGSHLSPGGSGKRKFVKILLRKSLAGKRSVLFGPDDERDTSSGKQFAQILPLVAPFVNTAAQMPDDSLKKTMPPVKSFAVKCTVAVAVEHLSAELGNDRQAAVRIQKKPQYAKDILWEVT